MNINIFVFLCSFIWMFKCLTNLGVPKMAPNIDKVIRSINLYKVGTNYLDLDWYLIEVLTKEFETSNLIANRVVQNN